MSVAWPMYADGHNVEFDGEWTKCWAQIQISPVGNSTHTV